MAIRFNINIQAAIEALLWVIQRGESNIYNIMKILYAAEKYHLNTYACPITGDRYVAMEYGTVPSWTFDCTKQGNPYLGFTKIDKNSLKANRGPDLDYLSESNIEALEYGFSEYAGLSFDEVLKKNHEEIAWKRAYISRGNYNVADIMFEDMIEEEWLIDELTKFAQFMVV
jgi:uncharacterized phage-associated protein